MFTTAMNTSGYFMEFEAFGNGGAFFNSVDLFRLGGTYVPANFQLVDWNIFAGAGQMSITFNSFLIYPDLSIDVPSISVAAGGTQTLAVAAGDATAGKSYLVMGSLSGIEPGFPLGKLQVPLALDAYTIASITNLNLAPLTNSFGILDANGEGTMQFTLPPNAPPSLAGLVLAHAFVVLDAMTISHVSNPVPLTLLP